MSPPRLTDSAIAEWAVATGATEAERALACDLRDCREQRRALLAEVREAERIIADLKKQLDERPVL